MILYFSGTGNSREVAGCLGRISGEKVLPLLEVAGGGKDALVLQEGEALGFVFPVYSWGPPPVVLEALERIRIEGVPEYVYFVCTCGDDTGKTADIFRKAVSRKGWTCETHDRLSRRDIPSLEVVSRPSALQPVYDFTEGFPRDRSLYLMRQMCQGVPHAQHPSGGGPSGVGSGLCHVSGLLPPLSGACRRLRQCDQGKRAVHPRDVHAGKESVNRLPLSGRESTEICPP